MNTNKRKQEIADIWENYVEHGDVSQMAQEYLAMDSRPDSHYIQIADVMAQHLSGTFGIPCPPKARPILQRTDDHTDYAEAVTAPDVDKGHYTMPGGLNICRTLSNGVEVRLLYKPSRHPASVTDGRPLGDRAREVLEGNCPDGLSSIENLLGLIEDNADVRNWLKEVCAEATPPVKRRKPPRRVPAPPTQDEAEDPDDE